MRLWKEYILILKCANQSYTSQPQLGVTLYKVTHILLTLLPEDLVFEMETLQIIHNGSAFIVRQTITLH